MKMVPETEIEMLGDAGSRLYAAVGPAIEGMRLRIVRDGISSIMELDLDETDRLRAFLDAWSPGSRKMDEGSLSFDAEHASFALYADTHYPTHLDWPYRTGLMASIRSQRHGSRWAFVEDAQVGILKRFVDQHAPVPAPALGR